MATSATIRCGDRRFFTYSDGYVSGLGRALSSACNDKQGEGFETLEQFADYLARGFNSDYGFKIEEGDGPGGEYEYTIEMTGPGGYWVSVYDQYKKEKHDDSEEDYFWASTRKSKNVKKEGRGKKCVNYLGMPVCPECGSPNLVEGEKDGDDTNCVCSRCYAKCWFNESDFDTGYGADHLRYRNGEVPESFFKSSTKKSKDAPKFSDMVNKQRDKNIKKDIPYSYFNDGMEVGGSLPEPMSREEAEYHCLRNIGKYSPPEFIHAIISLIADGDIEKYKGLYIERFRQIFD